MLPSETQRVHTINSGLSPRPPSPSRLLDSVYPFRGFRERRDGKGVWDPTCFTLLLWEGAARPLSRRRGRGREENRKKEKNKNKKRNKKRNRNRREEEKEQ